MNHSFDANCFEWFFDHPRFGVIPCEKTRRFVAKGEELTLDYEYDPFNCPGWFKEALLAFMDVMTEDQFHGLNKKYKYFIDSIKCRQVYQWARDGDDYIFLESCVSQPKNIRG